MSSTYLGPPAQLTELCYEMVGNVKGLRLDVQQLDLSGSIERLHHANSHAGSMRKGGRLAN